MALQDILGGAIDVGRQFLTPSKAVDVVAVMEQGSFTQAFAGARPLTATVHEKGKLMEHPLEDGSLIADHFVKIPTEIELPLLIAGADYKAVYSQIKRLYEAATILSVQTRTDTYSSMVIFEIPHEENADVFDGITLNLKLKEARFVKPEYGALSQSQTTDPAQSSTIARGSQQTKTTSPAVAAKASQQYNNSAQSKGSQGSTLYRLFN